jgi:hypothetical protein
MWWDEMEWAHKRRLENWKKKRKEKELNKLIFIWISC